MQLSTLLVQDGVLIASAPNIAGLRTKWKRLKGDPTLKHLTNYDRSGVHKISYATLTGSFTAAGFKVNKVIPTFPETFRWCSKAISKVFSM